MRFNDLGGVIPQFFKTDKNFIMEKLIHLRIVLNMRHFGDGNRNSQTMSERNT